MRGETQRLHSLPKAHVIRNHHPTLPGYPILDSLLLERHQLVPQVGFHPAQVNAEMCRRIALLSKCIANPSRQWDHSEPWSKASGLLQQQVMVMEGKGPHPGLGVVLARGDALEDFNKRGVVGGNYLKPAS